MFSSSCRPVPTTSLFGNIDILYLPSHVNSLSFSTHWYLWMSPYILNIKASEIDMGWIMKQHWYTQLLRLWPLSKRCTCTLIRVSSRLRNLGFCTMCKTVFCRKLLRFRFTRASIVRWLTTQIAKYMGPTWGPPRYCRPQMDPMLAPWTVLSGYKIVARMSHCIHYFLRDAVTHLCPTYVKLWHGWVIKTRYEMMKLTFIFAIKSILVSLICININNISICHQGHACLIVLCISVFAAQKQHKSLAKDCYGVWNATSVRECYLTVKRTNFTMCNAYLLVILMWSSVPWIKI